MYIWAAREPNAAGAKFSVELILVSEYKVSSEVWIMLALF